MLATANALLVLLVAFLVLATLSSFDTMFSCLTTTFVRIIHVTFRWKATRNVVIKFERIFVHNICHGCIRIPIFLWVPVHGANFFFNPASFGVPPHCSYFPAPGQSFHISARLWPTPPILSVYIMWTVHYIFTTMFHFNFVMCYRMLY